MVGDVHANFSCSQVWTDTGDTAFTRAEDLDGLLETLGRKAMLFEYRGEEVLVEEMRSLYAHAVEEAERREGDMLGRDV